MEIIWLMIPITILLGMVFLALFIINLNSGQYDDLETPAYRILIDESENKNNKEKEK